MSLFLMLIHGAACPVALLNSSGVFAGVPHSSPQPRPPLGGGGGGERERGRKKKKKKGGRGGGREGEREMRHPFRTWLHSVYRHRRSDHAVETSWECQVWRYLWGNVAVRVCVSVCVDEAGLLEMISGINEVLDVVGMSELVFQEALGLLVCECGLEERKSGVQIFLNHDLFCYFWSIMQLHSLSGGWVKRKKYTITRRNCISQFFYFIYFNLFFTCHIVYFIYVLFLHA